MSTCLRRLDADGEKGSATTAFSEPTQSRRTLGWLLPIVVLTAPLWIAIVLIVLLAGWARDAVIYAIVWTWWIGRAPRRTVFVYSDSPNWKQYVETEILPNLPANTVVLNWSERSTWSMFSFPVVLFHSFAGEREFNPIALVFERGRLAEQYRFWQPFRDAKHGRPEPLRTITEQLLVRLMPDATVDRSG